MAAKIAKMHSQALSTGNAQVKGTVLEPITLGIQADMQGEQGNVKLSISNIRLSISPDILELFMKLQTSVLAPLLQPAAEQPLAKCSTFTKVLIGSLQGLHDIDRECELFSSLYLLGAEQWCVWAAITLVLYQIIHLCFWPWECDTRTDIPSQAVSTQLSGAKLIFDLQVWGTQAESADGLEAVLERPTPAKQKGMTFWRPNPPAGFAATGDCVTAGSSQPSFQVQPTSLPAQCKSELMHADW